MSLSSQHMPNEPFQSGGALHSGASQKILNVRDLMEFGDVSGTGPRDATWDSLVVKGERR